METLFLLRESKEKEMEVKEEDEVKEEKEEQTVKSEVVEKEGDINRIDEKE